MPARCLAADYRYPRLEGRPSRPWLSVFAAPLLLSITASAHASEGASSIYVPGAYNDFAAGLAPPPGVYARNDLVRYEGEIGARPLGGRLDAGLEQTLWFNLLKLTWVTDVEWLGATYIAGINIPYVFDVSVDLNAEFAGQERFSTGSNDGFGDPYLVPIALNWANGAHHTTAAVGVNIPVGRYDEDDRINLGRHYWAIDPTITYSWLPASGWDLSLTAGILFNFENDATDYTTGDEFHLDVLAAKYVTPGFGLGVAGYVYEQLESDSGPVPDRLDDGFRSSGAGVGPAFMKSVSLGQTPVTLIGKWLHDVSSENRFDGDTVSLSAAWAF
ncbi:MULTISPECIES: SphA family protein [Halomonas]|uniref:SphA family protein n=1 Tax=Halomonas TaxID=2745 RepID=UPI001A8C1C31|nr:MULTISPECIES: transporter [Halomonas]MBN8411249.1 transporter [Halomonas litopenaei]MBY5985375.1 transporter [Halomonas sp. DP5Y7-2]